MKILKCEWFLWKWSSIKLLPKSNKLTIVLDRSLQVLMDSPSLVTFVRRGIRIDVTCLTITSNFLSMLFNVSVHYIVLTIIMWQVNHNSVNFWYVEPSNIWLKDECYSRIIIPDDSGIFTFDAQHSNVIHVEGPSADNSLLKSSWANLCLFTCYI